MSKYEWKFMWPISHALVDVETSEIVETIETRSSTVTGPELYFWEGRAFLDLGKLKSLIENEHKEYTVENGYRLPPKRL